MRAGQIQMVMCSPPIKRVYSPRKSQSTSLSGCEFSGAGKDALIWGSLCTMPAVSPERKSGNDCFRLYSTASTAMIFVFLSSRIKNTSVFVLIDLAGRTGVVLLCCGISIRKSEEKGIEGKLSWN